MNEEGNAAAALCIFRRPHEEISNGLIPLGHTVEVYDMEIHVALEDLRAVLNHSMAKYATKIVVCLDNEEASIRLDIGIATPSSSKQILGFQRLRHESEIRPRSRVSGPCAFLLTVGTAHVVQVLHLPAYTSWSMFTQVVLEYLSGGLKVRLADYFFLLFNRGSNYLYLVLESWMVRCLLALRILESCPVALTFD